MGMVEEQIRKRMDNGQMGGDDSRVCRLWNKTEVEGTESRARAPSNGVFQR